MLLPTTQSDLINSVDSWAASKSQQVCKTGRLDPCGAAPTTQVSRDFKREVVAVAALTDAG